MAKDLAQQHIDDWSKSPSDGHANRGGRRAPSRANLPPIGGVKGMRGAHLIAVLFCAGSGLGLGARLFRASQGSAGSTCPAVSGAGIAAVLGHAGKSAATCGRAGAAPDKPRAGQHPRQARRPFASAKAPMPTISPHSQAFYEARTGAPLWVTEMGFSARGQAALFEIGKADDWGLDAAAFDLPPAGGLPTTPEDQATAEIKLDLAILKYARFARGGRFNPSEISEPASIRRRICASQRWC